MHMVRHAFVVALVLVLSVFVPALAAAQEAPRITLDELLAILDSPDLVVLDARTAKDWKNSDKKIIGAQRVNPKDLASWAGDYDKDKKTIVY